VASSFWWTEVDARGVRGFRQVAGKKESRVERDQLGDDRSQADRA
jgi:hypothetical protein